MNDIDFVIFWLDSTDPAWQQEWTKAKEQAGENDDASLIRIRYWDNLHYWLRGVERFAPWVRKVHLVTWGHLPTWLHRDHPKLHIVNHRDFIPQEYLPTFNSLTIGMNLHHIEGLAEQFVVFNDDMFLTRACRPEDFFRKGLPCDMARLSVVLPSSIGHIVYNDLELINAKYRKNTAIRHNIGKWLNFRYGASNLLKTLTLMPWSMFTGMLDHHLPQPSLRSHWDACWREWHAPLDTTCRHTFRSITNVSDYLFRYDMLASGAFVPRSMADGLLTTLADDSINSICRDIETQRYRTVCLNDSVQITDFNAMKARLSDAFAKILPEKSSYER